MGMILRIASSRIVGQGDIVGRSGYFSLNLSANSVMRGRLDARRTLKSLVADLRGITGIERLVVVGTSPFNTRGSFLSTRSVLSIAIIFPAINNAARKDKIKRTFIIILLFCFAKSTVCIRKNKKINPDKLQEVNEK
ncbi:hypothetical protein BJP75_00007735 [Bacteroides thetaiotaomicron]|nr:hypothetical protein [Bacteroides thetaiotaomicron]